MAPVASTTSFARIHHTRCRAQYGGGAGRWSARRSTATIMLSS